MQQYQNIQPGRKVAKVALIKTAMFVMGRAWQTLHRIDHRLQEEVSEWPDGFRMLVKVRPNGPQWLMIKDTRGWIRHCGNQGSEDNVDMIIYFKNVESAFLVFSMQISIPQAYAEHRMTIKGDLRVGLSVMRSMNVVETYLLPHLLAKQVTKRPVFIPSLRKNASRLWMYLMGIPFGL